MFSKKSTNLFATKSTDFMKTLVISLSLLCFTAGYAQSTFTVLFDFNKYQLTTVATAQLDSFLLIEKQHLSTMSLQLNGHCDAIGSDEYNNKLSNQRVAAVKNYLLSHGIQADNIGEEIGHGKKIALNENKTAIERQLNRRVEISFNKITSANPPGAISLKEKIADSATKAGTNIILQSINFWGGRHQFLPESTPALKELLASMQTYPKLVIRIEGHICCMEDNADGLDTETGLINLSEARAKAIRDYLVENNINPERVTYKGFGHSSPIYAYPEKNEEERIKNRRVELRIVSK